MENIKGNPIDDAERRKLAEKLDKDLEDFIASCPKTEYKDGFSEDNWEQEIQMHPAFRTEEIKEGEELPPLVEAMRQLKYDPKENTPNELARNYKDDGNYNFKLKKYRWAIDSYTEGIKQKCDDSELNAQLFANRAASHYFLGNFRSSISDCKEAVQFKSDYIKAIVRAAKCCEELKHFDDGLIWCEKGLKFDEKNANLVGIKSSLQRQKKIKERDQRKNQIKENKLEKEEMLLLQEIKNRGIKLDKEISLSNLEPCHPAAVSGKVHLSLSGHLIWPVLFLYPEFGQTDFIQEFNEEDSFDIHLENMFGDSSETEPPTWDFNKKYIPKYLKLYFEDKTVDTLYEVDPRKSLKDILEHPSYIVYAGTPAFIITSTSTDHHKQFIKNYKFVKSF